MTPAGRDPAAGGPRGGAPPEGTCPAARLVGRGRTPTVAPAAPARRHRASLSRGGCTTGGTGARTGGAAERNARAEEGEVKRPSGRRVPGTLPAPIPYRPD